MRRTSSLFRSACTRSAGQIGWPRSGKLIMRSDNRTPRAPNLKLPSTSPRTLCGACRRADDISSAQNAATAWGCDSWSATSSAGRTR
eukprot:15444633-Alexandrium_andersonii.AAC.1